MNKVGVFGGTFNPIHLGHINSMLTVKDELKLDFVKVIPTTETPLKSKIEGATPVQRYEMAKLGVIHYDDILLVDDVELKRGGVSYTVDTLKALNSENQELYLIIGLDQFLNFEMWKEYKEILACAHLVVTSRPGCEMPLLLEDLPMGVQEITESFDGKMALLKTGFSIYFIQLDDVEISSEEIRKKLRKGHNVSKYILPEVEDYIKQNKLFYSVGDKVGDYRTLTDFVAQCLFDRKAARIKGFDLRELDTISEYSIIASGTSTRHAVALSEISIENVKEEFGIY
ncbi:MAG: nicotinate (nicotinamide) nucleotide adenylyltransferase, partial [Bdellovibrionales bacterium]|nr:nicotinate (nicotinamide) nucleotide adenylyltransferase [Bdellovibrionales bacterium]